MCDFKTRSGARRDVKAFDAERQDASCGAAKATTSTNTEESGKYIDCLR
jgi:hypothetical protein